MRRGQWDRVKVTVVVGPGPYDCFLLGALARAGVLYRAVRAWPRFLVEAWDPGNEAPTPLARASWYDGLQWLTWALWRRVPWARRYETPRSLLSALFDLLARRYVGECDLFVGWSQVSLQSLRRAKRGGACTLLEHPMSHVDTWMRLVREEYAQWGQAADGFYSLFPRLLVRRMRREYNEAEYISVLSSFSRRTFLEAGIAEERLIQLPLGVDPQIFHPGPPHAGPFRVLYVGRVELLKGVQYLLQAFSELRLTGAELWLAGPVLPEIGPILMRYESQQVRIVGEVPHAELPAYYRGADVLVFPSVNDAFGLVILEAMASGLPVIATEHSGGPDVIEDKVHGFVVPIRDVEALKERIAWLYANREEAREMGRRARARVLEGFTLQHYGERLLESYSHILVAEKPGA